MTQYPYDLPNPQTDLVLKRIVDVPPEVVWEAWTKAEHMKHWWCPKPWTTTEVELHVRPGGLFHTVMRSPEGKMFPNDGCYLEIDPNRKLVFTSVLGPGYRPTTPKNTHDFHFTAIITMEPHGDGGCIYIARAMHPDAAGAKRHADLGFHDGWGTVLDQLVAYMKTQRH